jgi:hypothetical protein
MRHVEKGGLLLSMPITHVLAVPDTPGSVHHWRSVYMESFAKEWQVQLPKGLLDVLSGVQGGSLFWLGMALGLSVNQG